MIRKKSLYNPESEKPGTKSGGPFSSSDAFQSNFDRSARKKMEPQGLAGRILLICIVIASVALVEHFLVTGPLQQNLLQEQARGLAKELDGLVSARSAALRVAADSLDIDNLSAAGGLDRLLSSLRSLFPDFLNIELLNSRGQTLAMMGDLNLSLAGTPKSAQVLVNSEPTEEKLLFRDDPANQSFLVIMRHGDPDAGYWFSRTRFSRKTIDSILASAGSGRSPVLVAHDIYKNQDQESESNATNSGPSVARFKDDTHTRWWNPRKSSEVELSVPGWTLRLESVPAWMDYCPYVLIPGLMLLLIGLFYIKRQDPKQHKGLQYSASHVVPQSVDPEWDNLSEFTYNAKHGSDRSRRNSTNEIDYSPGDPQILTAGNVTNFRNDDSAVEDSHSLGELLPEFFYEPNAEVVAPYDSPNNQTSDAQLTPMDPFPETLEVTWSEPRTNKTQPDSGEPQYVADSKVLGA
jgi:hypothetical protein